MIRSEIYIITNKTTNKIYVGSAVYIIGRFGTHKFYLRRNKHQNKYLQSAWNKYGEIDFEFKILEFVENKTKLKEREQYYIDSTNCCNPDIGYNLRPNASNNLGYKYSEKSKAKMSAWQIGRKMSDEAKLKMSLSQKKLNTWNCEKGKFCKCEVCLPKMRKYKREKARIYKKGYEIITGVVL